MEPESPLNVRPPWLTLRVAARGAEAGQLVRLARAPNWWVRGRTLERWTWESFTDVEGFLTWRKDLGQAAALCRWDRFPEFWSWPRFRDLLEVLVLLVVNDELPRVVRPDLVLLLGSGEEALGLSRGLTERLARILPRGAEAAPAASRHPWSAWFGTLLTRWLSETQGLPLGDRNLPWKDRVAELDPVLADLLRRCQIPERVPPLGEWRQVFLSHPEAPPRRTLSPEERAVVDRRVRRFRRFAPFREGLERGWALIRRHRLALGLGGLLLALLLVPEFCTLRRTGVEQGTEWVTDEEAIFGYYEAFNALEASRLRNLSQSPEARQDIWEVGQLYVFRETRRATLGDSGLISLNEWRRQGEPPVGEGLTVYGVDVALVQRLDQDLFEVLYHRARWDREKLQGRPVVDRVVDRIRLDRQGGQVRIVFLSREARPYDLRP